MLKKESGVLAKQYCLFSFILLISAAFILGVGVTPANAAKKADVQKAVTGLVDINNATQKELEAVKGVGPSTAKKIIAGRPYKSVDELSKAGVSAKAIDAMKPFVTVGSAPTTPVATAVTRATTAVKEKKTEVQKSITTGPVDINNAPQKDLEALKGVGPTTAKKIIAGRPYKSVDELSKAGIKPKAIEAMKPFVTVGNAPAAPVTETATKAVTKATAPVSAAATDLTTATDKVKTKAKSAAAKLAPGTKININSADQAMLEKLPEIGPVKAKAIVDGRPYNTIEDVMKVKGIKGKTFDAIKDYIVVK